MTSPARTRERPAFRKPGDTATLPELIKFLNDRSGYIRALEDEGTPESFSRIENLKELANAAQDAQERGETLDEFLDHAALASDADQYSAEAQVTLMTLHAAKGLEFPLVFLAGMEEGLFPHSRTMMDPTGLEEERRLCYVGMTRAMDTLVMTRARYRRRYGNDSPEATWRRGFWRRCLRGWWRTWGARRRGRSFQVGVWCGSGLYATPYPKANRFGACERRRANGTRATRMKTRAVERAGERRSGVTCGAAARRVARGRWTILPASLQAGDRNLAAKPESTAEAGDSRADGKDRPEAGNTGAASEVWRRNRVSSRRRWG